MTVKELIDIVDGIKPNQYGIEDKVRWLSFVEHTIINDVIMAYEGYEGQYDDFEGYSPDKLDIPLIVKPPHDRLYEAYLKMKIDEENGETARYNNSATMYNTYLMEYKKWYNKNRMVNCSANRRTSPSPSMPPARPPQAEPMDKEAIKQIEENKTSIQKLRQSLTNEVVTRENAIANERKVRESADSIERAERIREIAVERARINAFVTLKEGSTTGDAELNDARVDKDGNIHANAGEHIRSVTGQLSGEIVDLANISKIEKMYNKSDVSLGYWTENGTIVELENGDRHITKKYDVEGGDYISYNGILGDAPAWQNCVFFDNANNVVSVFKPQTGGNGIYVPYNATKLSFGLKESELSTFNLLVDRIANKNVVTPEMFGAKGGENDDYFPIQTALNYSAENKKILYLPRSYNISKTIKVPANSRIEGCGLYKCFLNNKNETDFAFTLMGEGVSINNLSIVGGHGISFGDETVRKSGTFIGNMQMIDVGIAISIKCASGYNYFKNIHIRDRGVEDVIILGGDNTPSPFVNYVYFDDVTCEVNGHGHDFSAVNTCVRFANCYYIYFNKCDFVGYFRAFSLTSAKLASQVITTQTTFYNCATDFYVDSSAKSNYRDFMFDSCGFVKTEAMPDTAQLFFCAMGENCHIMNLKFTKCFCSLPSVKPDIFFIRNGVDLSLDIVCNRAINESVRLDNCIRTDYQESYTPIDGVIGESGSITFDVNTNKMNMKPIKDFTWCLVPTENHITDVICDKTNGTITFKGASGTTIKGVVN